MIGGAKVSETEPTIAIVGAGVAGSFLAWNLALRGFKVQVFDHSVPREKPCGGGISPLAFKRFPMLSNLKFSKNVVRKYKFVAGNNAQVERTLREPLTIASRLEFDSELLNQAVENGAEFFKRKVRRIKFLKKGIVIGSGSDEKRADIVIGADGVSSAVRSKVTSRIPSHSILPIFGYYIKGLTDDKIIIKCFEDMYGYLWAFPRKDHISIGIGGYLNSHEKEDLRDRLEKFIEENFPNALQKEKWVGFIPIINSTKFYDVPFSGENWLLIGDAAGQVNPITGEGIIYALLSAELAVQAISVQQLSQYRQIWEANYGRILLRKTELKGTMDKLPFHDRCKNYQALLGEIDPLTENLVS